MTDTIDLIIPPAPHVDFPDVMVDIETLDTTPTAAILAIGAVRFNLTTGKLGGPEFYRNVTLDTDDFTVNHDTFHWWLRQEALARTNLTEPQPVGVSTALYDLETFLIPPLHTLWQRGNFDIPILAHAFTVCLAGPPWPHRTPRDVRTLEHTYSMLTSEPPPERPPGDTPHHALDDARWQAQAVVQMWQELRDSANGRG